MAKFALGKKAFGISDRSGFRYRLNTMRKEWNGLLVGPDEWEPKHPQLEPRRRPTDPQALRDPRPDGAELIVAVVGVPLVEAPNLRPVWAIGQVGTVEVVTT